MDLEVLAKSLDEGCKAYKTPFRFCDYTDKTISGLGSYLYIVHVEKLISAAPTNVIVLRVLWSGGTVTEKAYFSFLLNILGRSRKHSLKSSFLRPD